MMSITLPKVVAAKRKASVTRVTLRASGGLTVNKKPFADYFDNVEIYTLKIQNVLDQLASKFDYGYSCNTKGGGKSAQSDSVLYAIGKALREVCKIQHQDDESALKSSVKFLRSLGMITIDRRRNKPKRYGHVKFNKIRQRPIR